MYRLERSLIDTGEATPSQKQPQAYTSRRRVLLGSPGLKFYFHFIKVIITSLSPHQVASILKSKKCKCQKRSTSTGTIILKHSVRVLHILVHRVPRNQNIKPIS